MEKMGPMGICMHEVDHKNEADNGNQVKSVHEVHDGYEAGGE
jgi:hypothetical protein